MKTQLINRECLAEMDRLIEEGVKVDMILCDLPYGTTNCKWDSIIPLDQLWDRYKKLIKEDGAIVLTAAQPFTTELIESNKKWFKYCWYWVKNTTTGFCFAKYQPLRKVEEVCVFYKKTPKYNPQGVIKLAKPKRRLRKPVRGTGDDIYSRSLEKEHQTEYTNYPNNVLEVKSERGYHPTQKPARLMEYLIKTYTQPGDLVLDNCMGSGTTGVACKNTGRNFIGIELNTDYFEIAKSRIEE